MTQEQWDHVQDLLNYKEILKIERTRLSDEIWAIDNSLSKNFKEISSVCGLQDSRWHRHLGRQVLIQ
jgi:hypothetical protein